jgi:hypothetical protein
MGTEAETNPGTYAQLRLYGEMFWGIQELRKAQRNRERAGEVINGLPIEEALQHIEDAESILSKAMVAEYRATAPEAILRWREESPGVGEHLLARLLGVIGEPYIANPCHWEGEGKGKRHLVGDPPYIRTVGQLWAYCGVGDPARRRRKGMSKEDAAAAGTWRAKTILWIIAVACTKQPGSRYEIVYRKARIEYEDRVHDKDCPQCKGSSKPGQPWKAGHQHAAALRKVSKEILRDLWEADRADYIRAYGE